MYRDAERWAKIDAPGCVNAAGKLRQEWLVTAGTTFTKPGALTLANLSTFKRTLPVNSHFPAIV